MTGRLTGDKANQALTKLNNYAVAHSDVIDASWIVKVIEEVRAELSEGDKANQQTSDHELARGTAESIVVDYGRAEPRSELFEQHVGFVRNRIVQFARAYAQWRESQATLDKPVSVKQAPQSQELIAAAEQLLAWQPNCSLGSSGDLRQKRLRAAIDNFGRDGSLNEATGVKADLEHPGNDTGGETADSHSEAETPRKPLSEELAEARRMTEWERELRLKIVSFINSYYLADVPDTEEDGFGGGCVQPCHECGLRLMQVVRPGKVQCGLCG